MAGVQLQAPYPVPSVVSFHPDIPDDVAARLALSNGIAQGATVTLAMIQDAESAPQMLESIKHREPTITEEVISTAKNRAHVLRSIVSQSTFPNPADRTIQVQLDDIQGTLGDIQGTLGDMQNTLRDMQNMRCEFRDSLRRIEAKEDNARIVFINTSRRQQDRTGTVMLKKVVPGDGLQLATAVAPPNHAVPDVPLGEVGQPYDQNLVETSELSHVDILAILRFYNESFGIVADDDRDNRIRKITNTLTGVCPF